MNKDQILGWTHCWVCKCELTKENTDERLDAFGNKWCKKCTEDFDSVEWDKEKY